MQNGTVIHLAKVPGSPEYIKLMEFLITRYSNGDAPEPERAHSWFWSMVMSYLGLDLRYEKAHVGKMFHDLKEESENVLAKLNKANGERWEREILVAQVSAPYIHTWYKDWTRGCVVYDGLEMANISPVTYMSDDPLYLVDTNAVFVDTGRSLCVDRDCNGHQSFSWGKDDYEARTLFTARYAFSAPH